jgi:hypothetical protein
MECFRSSIYSVLMFASRMMRPYSLYCLRRYAPNSAPHVLTGATLDDQIRLHLGYLRRCGEPAGELGDRFLRCLNCATTIRGGPVTRPPCQSQQCGVSDFHSYAAGVDELARDAQDANNVTAIRVMNALPCKD